MSTTRCAPEGDRLASFDRFTMEYKRANGIVATVGPSITLHPKRSRQIVFEMEIPLDLMPSDPAAWSSFLAGQLDEFSSLLRATIPTKPARRLRSGNEPGR